MPLLLSPSEAGRFSRRLLLTSLAAVLPVLALALAGHILFPAPQYWAAALGVATGTSALIAWLGACYHAAPVQALARMAEQDETSTPQAWPAMPEEFVAIAARLWALTQGVRQSVERERAAQANFQRIFESLPVPAALYSGNLARIVRVNDAFCRFYDRSREQLLGHMLGEYGLGLTAEVRPVFLGMLQRDRKLSNLEVPVHAPDGQIRRVLASAEYLELESHEYVLTVQVDVTDRQLAEVALLEIERAQAANSAKTQFLSRMSHELRTPLNAVLGFSQLLRQSTQGKLSADELHQLQLVHLAGTQLSALIDDILDLSRIEAGRLPVDIQPVDLNGLLSDMLSLCAAQAQEYGVKLSSTLCSESRPMVSTDPTRFRQALLNVVSNAIKYNRPGGEVRLSVSQDGSQAQVVVQDTGLGMSEAQLAAVFEPFNRLGRERGSIPGTGIGMALTRELMTLLDGSIDIQSVEGQGTTVSLLLPSGPLVDSVAVSQGSGDTQVRPPQGLGADAQEPAGTILYIEDIELNTFLVKSLLDAWAGVVLVAAPNGTEGLRLAEALRPDLVLLDMQLPDMTGQQVLDSLRSSPATKHLPVVALSANAMPADIAAARAAGADDYWTKPIDFTQFRQGVQRWLSSERSTGPEQSAGPAAARWAGPGDTPATSN